MRSPSGWAEPGQRPEFDEFTIVLHGELVVESGEGPAPALAIFGSNDPLVPVQASVARLCRSAFQSPELRGCQDGRVEILSSRVLLRPADLGRSRHFYRDVLGLAVYREFGSPDDPGMVFFLGPGFLEVSGHSAGAAGHAVMLWLQVRDINAEHQRLAAAGARILREPVTEPWGLTEMWIEDPDGVRIVLVEVPADHPLRRDSRSSPPRSSTDDISPA